MLFIINIKAKPATYIKKLFIIYCCYINKLDYSDIGYIIYIKRCYIIIVGKNMQKQLIKKVDLDINYTYYNFNLSNYSNFLLQILEPIINKIKILKKYLTKVKYNYLSKNVQIIILYNIILNKLFYNY